MKPILALRHVPHEELGLLEEVFRHAGLVYSTVDVFRGALMSFDPRQLAGLVVLGGPMNVDQTGQYPFLADEVRWLQESVTVELPVLGICLGSQLLAKALGSRVVPNAVQEIGWYEIELTAAGGADPLFAGCRETETVFQWHGDTFDLPPGAVQLAKSRDCPQQAFRYGPSAYGLQFHMEVTGPMIETWFAEPCNCTELAELEQIDVEAIRAAGPRKLPAMHALGRRVFGRFAALCRRRSSA